VKGNIKMVLRDIELGMDLILSELCSISDLPEDTDEPLNFIQGLIHGTVYCTSAVVTLQYKKPLLKQAF
jgi:hypothetical protein